MFQSFWNKGCMWPILVILVIVCQVHGWRRTGVFDSSWKSGLSRPSPEQLVSQRSKGGCESCQCSFQNNDITTLTSSFSCTPAGQRYITTNEGRKKDVDLVLYSQVQLKAHIKNIQMGKSAACYVCQIKSDGHE